MAVRQELGADVISLTIWELLAVTFGLPAIGLVLALLPLLWLGQ